MKLKNKSPVVVGRDVACYVPTHDDDEYQLDFRLTHDMFTRTMKSSIHTKSTLGILGLMTGSSADGLDVCLVEFSGTGSNPDFKLS
ncbi:MAG: hypothetical protein KAH12_12030, partial [Anaerolineales bacterium]|nr:hypothetical protein [Anaerolineales bacterium]